jgi:predicted 3-demethylubiquinone-9 3-methyltransferase (glyoxalase superfamily)
MPAFLEQKKINRIVPDRIVPENAQEVDEMWLQIFDDSSILPLSNSGLDRTLAMETQLSTVKFNNFFPSDSQ